MINGGVSNFVTMDESFGGFGSEDEGPETMAVSFCKKKTLRKGV